MATLADGIMTVDTLLSMNGFNMDELQKAMAEFAAKQGVTIVPPTLDAKAYKQARKDSWKAQQEVKEAAQAYENAERNAENMRYDKEGVYYIGGKR